MKLDAVPWWAWAVAGLGVAAVLWKASGRSVADAGQAIGTAAVDAAGGVVTGVATGVGDAVGIPRTNETKCQQAMREGRSWDASFDCPASTFLRYWWNGTPIKE